MPASKNAPALLAEKLVQALRDQKHRGAAYPLPLKNLADLVDPRADARIILGAVRQRKAFGQHALAARADLQAPVALLSDLPLLAGSSILLEYVLAANRTASNQAATVAKLKIKLTAKLQRLFQEVM